MTDIEPLLTAAQVAHLLSFSPSSVLDRWERGEIPGFKIGRAVRFRASEVELWLEGQRRGPMPAGATGVGPVADVGTEA